MLSVCLLVGSGCGFLLAQPGFPSFCFTVAEKDGLRPTKVVQHFRERVDYKGFNGSYLKDEEVIVLQAAPIAGMKGAAWLVYHPLEGMAESHVRIIAGPDTMRIDLPEDPSPLVDRAWSRGPYDTPEVIRFRKGRFALLDLIHEADMERKTNKLAKELATIEERSYKRMLEEQEVHHRSLPPPKPFIVPQPAPTPTEIIQEIASRPGLKVVDVARASGDTVWLRITGRVMLNGGCGNDVPLIGIEMRTDSGWVERLPMDRAQMDCGMPWVDWRDQEVMLPPLRWWVDVNSPVATKELHPGTYRIVLMGANLKTMASPAFQLP